MCSLVLSVHFSHLAEAVDPEASVSSVGSLEDQSEPAESTVSDSKEEAVEALRIFSLLAGIEIKLFNDEPQLVI